MPWRLLSRRYCLSSALQLPALPCSLRDPSRTVWLNVAGLLTFVGIAVSILIDPDQIVRLLELLKSGRLTGSINSAVRLRR